MKNIFCKICKSRDKVLIIRIESEDSIMSVRKIDFVVAQVLRFLWSLQDVHSLKLLE